MPSTGGYSYNSENDLKNLLSKENPPDFTRYQWDTVFAAIKNHHFFYRAQNKQYKSRYIVCKHCGFHVGNVFQKRQARHLVKCKYLFKETFVLRFLKGRVVGQRFDKDDLIQANKDSKAELREDESGLISDEEEETEDSTPAPTSASTQ